MGDYWTDRALPVLRALEAPSDAHVRDGFLSLGRGRAEKNLGIELSGDAAHDTIMQLSDAGYVEFKKLSYESGGVLTYRAYISRAVGLRCWVSGLALRPSCRRSRSPCYWRRWPSTHLPMRQRR